MASRFGNTTGSSSQGGQINIYTVLALVGFLIMLVGVVWMIFHNHGLFTGLYAGLRGWHLHHSRPGSLIRLNTLRSPVPPSGVGCRIMPCPPDSRGS